MTVGPLITLPWGLTLYTVIGTIVLVIISEIWWKVMKHFPEDDQPLSEGNRFVIESDMDDEGKEKK